MILSRVEQVRQSLSDHIDGGLPNGAGEEMWAQGGSKGRFYKSKSFATGSIRSPLRIGLIGASGKLGKTIADLADPSFQIIASFNRAHLPRKDPKIDLFLDVSTASALEENLRIALLSQKPIVVGTTGHTSFELLKTAALSIPVFYSSNFSLGMALMRRASIEFAKKFHTNATIDLIETHRLNKKDAPSGSALMLAKGIEAVHPARVAIQSIRSGDTPGEHVLFFRVEEEHLSLTHTVQNRNALAKGAIKAAHFLSFQKTGLFGMDDLLYGAQEGLVNLDSARQSQIEAPRSERGVPSPRGKGDEEDRFGEVAASPNSPNLTERRIT